MKILVACPICESKGYALGRWLEAWQAFDYSDRAMFMVDNTPDTLSFTHRLRSHGIPAVHVEPMTAFWDTMEVCWRLIVQHAHEIGAEWIASIECDVICPPETLSVLLAHAGGFVNVAHAYPDRRNGAPTVSLGCALLSTRAMYETRDLTWLESMESIAFSRGPNWELRGVLSIEHLDG